MPISAIIIIAVVFLYPILAGLILRASEDTRMQFAERASKLLSSPHVAEDYKVLISYMADDVFDWKFMARATLLFPKIVLSSKKGIEPSSDDKKFIKTEGVYELFNLHKKCVMAASPFFTVTFFIVFALMIVCVLSFRGFSLLKNLWMDTVKEISPIVGVRI